MVESAKIHVKTKRFYLREIVTEDVSTLYRLHSDPVVHAFLGNNTVKSTADIYELVNNIQEQYNSHGIGRWAVFENPVSLNILEQLRIGMYWTVIVGPRERMIHVY